jgi:hypothetical protein
MKGSQRYLGIAADVLVGVKSPPDGGRGVLVLGMHRSGTSAITSVIGRLGPDLGDRADLIAPNGANEKGYWESRRLTELQESLLEKLGGDWETPPTFRPGWERDWRLVRRLGLARRTFRDVYKGAEQWVWKDPRTTLLLPFWRRALQFDPIVVGIFRNPHEVADSLGARDDMPKRKALRLWETYNRALLTNARGIPAFVTSYDDLLSDSVGVARTLSGFLEKQGIAVRRPTDDILRSCIDADLRHSVHTAREVDAEDALTDAQRALFEELREARGEYPTFPDLSDRFERLLESGRPG